MYAAAGGASLASRQARRKENKKHHVISSDAVHQQFQRRFQQLHQEHARLYQTDINGRIPAHDIEGMTSTGMQAALYIREKKKQQRLRRGRRRFELPSHVATKEIAPFPPYPPNNWGKASAAWSERERRGSAGLEGYQVAHGRVKASDSHRKWTRRNRIHDSSYGGSSSEGEDEGAGGVGAAGRGAEQSAAANALLYVGLGTVAIGLVIAFVGTGEKGFKTLELRLIGPTLIFGGLLCCLLRILLCVCPSRCPFWGRKGGGGKRRPPDHDYYRHLPYRSRTANDFLLAEPPPPTVTNASRQGGGDKKRVSIVQTPGAVDRRPPRSSSTWRGGGGGGDPLHAGDSVELLELRSGCGVGGGGGPGGGAGGASASGADLHSASSEDSFNESLALVEASETRKPRDERLARLKSTLTFQDDVDDYDVCPGTSAASSAAMAAVATSTCPRIDEEREEEMTSSHSASPQPLPLPPPPAPLQPQPSTSFARRELVLSPAKLQNI